METVKKAILVLSGGQDSTTCGFWAKKDGMELHAITFDYGQRHVIEIDAALRVGELLGVKSHEVISLPKGILQGTSPLVDPTASLEQYADHNSLPGGLEKTFVPMRNQLFLTIAANRAYVKDCGYLITGVCQEDSGGYPDCRLTFIESMEETCGYGTFTGEDGAPGRLRILTPLMHVTKAQAVQLALNLPGCFEALAFTHTSYDGQYPPNGSDHATLLRAKGFAQALLPDPLIVRAWAEGLMDLPDAPNYSTELIAKYLPYIGRVL